jgi:hypothetical protein
MFVTLISNVTMCRTNPCTSDVRKEKCGAVITVCNAKE